MAGAAPSADTPAHAARRALLDQLDQAIEAMGTRSDVAIHEVRTQIKRGRATLRLLREYIGAEAYRRDNALMRDAARPLRPVRDAKVLLDTFERLGKVSNRGKFLREFHSVLEQRRDAAKRRLRPGELAAAAKVLRSIRGRVAALSNRTLSQPDRTDLERTYRKGRKALARAKRRATEEYLHEWRKQTKYLQNQLELVLPFGPKFFAKSHHRAGRLADRLGDDHDLALLTEQILQHAKAEHSPSQDEEVQDLIVTLSRKRKKLQAKAFRLGRRLYSDRARRYHPKGFG